VAELNQLDRIAMHKSVKGANCYYLYVEVCFAIVMCFVPVDKRLDGKTAKKNRRRAVQLSRAADNERVLIRREQKVLVELCSVNRSASAPQVAYILKLLVV